MLTTAQSIGKIIPTVLKQTGLSKKKGKTMARLEKDWVEIMGNRWSTKTYPLGIKQNILQIGVQAAVLLYELAHFHKTQILKRLKAKYPEKNFRDINFIVGTNKEE